ncbi:MAG: hypothetical protein Q9168_000216 [Polycauliona sp. 1 TL-2023]
MAGRLGSRPLKQPKSLGVSHNEYRNHDIEGRLQRGATGGAQSARGSGRRIRPRTATTTRAERRASLFGHKENPPEGYKGLPFKTRVTDALHENNREERRPVYSDLRGRGNTDSKTLGRRQTFRETRNNPLDEGPRTRERVEVRTDAASPSLREERGGADTHVQKRSLHGSKEQPRDTLEDRPRKKSNAPLAIPYTTPASEFLYGHSVVTLALKSSRRTFYRLYLYDGDSAEVRGQDKQVRKLALAANVEVTRVGNDWIKLMDKMSGGRPHNGYILEASPLPKLPVTGLKHVPSPSTASQPTFDVILDHQSREEEAVNGVSTTVPYNTGHQRYPFLLLLEGIRDPGNMGAIIRTSHFLGVDGILICTRNSAALTPVALKAAAGAAETMPLFSVSQSANFIDECQVNGWKFYAAVCPNSSEGARASSRPYFSSTTLGNPTRKHPCVLILGSEGDGLRWNIQKKADFTLGIEGQRSLDSLNVSVASALLCDAFLRESGTMRTSRKKGQERRLDDMKEDKLERGADDNLLPRAEPIGEEGIVGDDQRLF